MVIRMARKKTILADPMRRWGVSDAADIYGVARWGCGYFSVNDAGHVAVSPDGANTAEIDLRDLVEEIKARGIQLPILVRFADILRSRVRLINEAFSNAIAESGYTGEYRGVYPIKVNQSRKVVQQIIEFGEPYHYGLEAGSKPELLVVMALHKDEDALIVCNGYKDEEYIETALLASKLGRTVVLVIEKPTEVEHIYRVAERLGVRPTLGIRARLTTRGAGRWEQSGGDQSKFGLSAGEILEAVAKLSEWKMLDCFALMHFHLGSQISAIRSIKNALREAGRIYVELHKIGCSGLRYFDVGGGLGVDYDGSQTNFASSMNYTVQEYSNDIVYALQELCEETGVPPPTIVSESGRAIAAHHCVLITDILGVTEFAHYDAPKRPAGKLHPLVENLFETYEDVKTKTLLESYHDALEYKDQVLSMFNLGHLSLADRVTCEQLFWATIRRIQQISSGLSHVPEELEGIEGALSDTYFCNFSTFQSLPDSWAVGQLFPIMPIHRLDERPTRRGILADITCDSDGKIDEFIDLRDVKKVLELHPKNGAPYHLGIFLVGAYQEILGDMHNLFGDTHTVHVSLDPEGGYCIDEVVMGDSIAEVLQYVDYSPESLLRSLRKHTEDALRAKRITLEESKQLIKRFREGLSGYTYLDTD